MMDWTDRHCRAFHRASDAPCAALHRDGHRRCGDPRRPRAAARVRSDRSSRSRCSWRLASRRSWPRPRASARSCGYREINLNVGCPSDRVQSGAFGACLMREPELVADCLAAMREAVVAIPVTVKHRLGVDDARSARAPRSPSSTRCRRAGITTFIVHARKAWLRACRRRRTAKSRRSTTTSSTELKRARPDLEIILNGGIADPR